MADNKQLEILKKGVEAWNAWRIDNRGVIIDLAGANLFEANLDGADLTNASLANARLINADLTRANLTRAHLTNANFYGADLSHAILDDARNITVNQLVKTKTLYRAKMDSAIKIEIMKIKPELVEEPSQ